jgi:hypothetical protein
VTGIRKKLEMAALGLIVVGGAAYVVYPHVRDLSSCDSSVPTSDSQRLALDTLKSRKASECEGPGMGCQYLISEDDDGSIRIKFYDVYGATGSGCLAIDCCWEDHVFSARGTYLRCDGCAA